MVLQLNRSYKVHFLIATAISIWLVSFLILIAPFDISDLDIEERFLMMHPYGIITFLGIYDLDSCPKHDSSKIESMDTFE